MVGLKINFQSKRVLVRTKVVSTAVPRVFSPSARVASSDKKGTISEQDINANCIRISKLKITLGIYVNPISSSQTKACESFMEKISNIDQEIKSRNHKYIPIVEKLIITRAHVRSLGMGITRC